MKFRIATFTALSCGAVACAMPAQAQSASCADLIKVITGATDSFIAVTGGDSTGNSVQTEITLLDDAQCKVRLGMSEIYTCHRAFYADEAGARKAQAEMLAAAKTCLPGWTSRETRMISQPPSTFKNISVIRLDPPGGKGLPGGGEFLFSIDLFQNAASASAHTLHLTIGNSRPSERRPYIPPMLKPA